MIQARFSGKNYLATLEALGEGVLVILPDGELAVQPLPKYRRQRTPDGRHEK